MRRTDAGVVARNVLFATLALLVVASNATRSGRAAPVAGGDQDGVALDLVGQLGGGLGAVAVQDSHAYVAIGPRLVVFEIVGAGRVEEVGRTEPLPMLLHGVAVSEGYAYVVGPEPGSARRFGGIRVIDVSNPSEPKVAGALEVEWGLGMVGPVELVVARGYLYLAMGRAGLWVVDVRSPQQPRLAGTYQPSAWVLGVAAKGDLLVLPVGDAGDGETRGLMVYSIVDPARPRELARLDMDAWPRDVALAGDHALVASSRGLRVVDLHDGTSPRELGLGEAVGSALLAPASRVISHAGTAYVLTSNGRSSELLSVDVEDPERPRLVAAPLLASNGARVLAAGPAMLLVGEWPDLDEGPGGLRAYDLRDPAAPREVAWIGTIAEASALAADGGRVVVGDWNGGVTAVDLGNPESPRALGAAKTWAMLSDVALVGSSAYVLGVDTGGTGWGLQRLRLSEDGQLELQAELPLSGDASPLTMHLAVDRDHAYVTSQPTGLLHVIRLRAAEVMDEVAALAAPGMPGGLALAGDYLYVALAESEGLPGAPDPTPTPRPTSAPFGLADETGGLWVVDVSDPSAPRPIAVAGGPGPAYDVATIGEAMLALSAADGLHILDLTDPASPREIGAFKAGYVGQVTVRGKRLFGTGTTFQDPVRGQDVPTIWVLDISDPTLPIELGHADAGGSAVAVVDDLVLVASDALGLRVLRAAGDGTSAPTSPPGPTSTRSPSPPATATRSGRASVTPRATAGRPAVYLPVLHQRLILGLGRVGALTPARAGQGAARGRSGSRGARALGSLLDAYTRGGSGTRR